MKKFKSLTDLMVMQLYDLYYVEKQLVKVLPRLSKNTYSDELRNVLEDHLKDTEVHLERLEQVFEDLNINARSKSTPAVSGLMEEIQELLTTKDLFEPPIFDAALIGAAQKAEHYEIVCYGTARAYASPLGYRHAERLLQQTLDEEYAADQKLNRIAEEINIQSIEEESE